MDYEKNYRTSYDMTDNKWVDAPTYALDFADVYEKRAYPKRSPLWLRKLIARVRRPVVVIAVGSFIWLAMGAVLVGL